MTTLLDTTIKEPCRILIEQEGEKVICTVTPIEKPVEKFEPEDGDVITHTFSLDLCSATTIGILKGQLSFGNYGFPIYAGLCAERNLFIDDFFGNNSRNNRPATDEEKQRLFDALEKAGKRWNAEEKRIEDIPEEPEVGDWCLFWDSDPSCTVPGILKEITPADEWKYCADTGVWYKNAVIWDKTFEHLERIRRGEI